MHISYIRLVLTMKLRICNRYGRKVSRRCAKNINVKKQSFNAKRRPADQYAVGQQVLVLASNEGKSKKLLSTFSGPYINVQTLPHNRYVVKDLPGTHRSQKFNR
ncbi:hypothetical protein Zmor_018915 [Zophobas morio]|uniref:Uncharacterized protein n=1 Tax=Zophobas morio TaxID=2755281 RepID=A0AA38IFK5_9CUCU|nr:hypothetical protein Zmor_018915 [Zophobas morio]